jgi:DNA repair exonuclease SbcCD ATPase subunit
LNLETGKASKNYVATKNGDGKAQIAVLEVEQKSLSAKLIQAREAERRAAALPALLEDKNKTTERGKRMREEQETWRARIENLPKLKNEFAEIENNLNALGNPKAKLVAFENEIKRESDLKEKLSQTEQNLINLESEKLNFNSNYRSLKH